MNRTVVILGAVLLVGAIAAAIVPMWIMTAGMGMSNAGYSAVAMMLLFCFAIGGGLMFLVFFSAHRGHDDAVHGSGIAADGTPRPPGDGR